MDQEEAKVALDRLRVQIGEQKHEICLLFAELKLKLPTYLKTLTIAQLREAGGIVDPNIFLPKETGKSLRAHTEVKGKQEEILEKVKNLQETRKIQIITFYNELKRQIPCEILQKRLEDLDSEEWNFLGINLKTHPSNNHLN